MKHLWRLTGAENYCSLVIRLFIVMGVGSCLLLVGIFLTLLSMETFGLVVIIPAVFICFFLETERLDWYMDFQNKHCKPRKKNPR